MDAHHLLRSARLARGISLDEVITRTRMSPRVVKALDDGRFGDLPAGIYARSYLRMFAGVIGLDRQEVDQVAPLLPDTTDPLLVIKEIVVEQELLASRERTRALRTCVAAILDAFVLLAIEGAALEGAARLSGTTSAALASTAAIPLALVFAAIASIYFLLLAGISGTTIGTRACGVELLAPERKLDLMAIATRAGRACLMEASLVATIGRSFNRRSSLTDDRRLNG